METRDLYRFADKKNIEILDYPMPYCGSMSIMDEDGNCYIGIDVALMDTDAVEKVHLAHELGHCMTGSFYSRHTAVDSRQRHEIRADKWAIRKLIPVDKLDSAVAEGCTELWELAERFGVTEGFMKKAICLYVHGNVAEDLYF